MQIIPVLDIMGGQVVRGMMGDRANYRPIETPLSASPEPLSVARGLLSLGDFQSLYIADLDAISGRPSNASTLQALGSAFPGLELWVDAGVRDLAEVEVVLAMPGVVAVVGSESVGGAQVLERLRGNERVILSLDYRGDAFLGPPELEHRPDLWPSRVIAMTLAKVGSGAGPDLTRLREIGARAGEGRGVFAAGGVRDPADLATLKQAGIAGALVASALHDGRLDRASVARCHQDKVHG